MSAQGVDAGVGLAHVAGHHGQIGYRKDVVGSPAVLGNTQGIEYLRLFRLGVQASGPLQQSGIDAGDSFDDIRRVIGNGSGYRIKAACAVVDESTILQTIAQDDVHQTVQQCNVAAGFQLQPNISHRGEFGFARVGHDQAGAFTTGLPHFGRNDRMGFRRVCANDKQHFATADFTD